jgi:hypothetical protein
MSLSTPRSPQTTPRKNQSTKSQRQAVKKSLVLDIKELAYSPSVLVMVHFEPQDVLIVSQ